MKIIYTLFIISVVSNALFAQGLELKPYGFLKGDAVYSSKGVLSFGNPNLSAPSEASGVDEAALGFTAKHSRVGLKGTYGEDIKVGGVVEIDFFSTNGFDTNVNPRLRLAYASLAVENWEFKVGQQWDIFSPNNANTNNTNGNMWYAGNRGFRRGQIQLSYKIDNKSFAPMFQIAFAEATREDAGLGKDNLSGMPMFQARVSGKIADKYTIGVSYVNASYLETKNTIEATGTIKDTLKSDRTYKTSGFGVDINLPIHKYFSLLGEFNTGTNLQNANLFNISNVYTWSIDDVTKKVIDNNRKSMGFWLNATSTIKPWLQVVVGYGCDRNTSDKYAIGDLSTNKVLYGDLVFPIKHGFSVALEYQYITTNKINSLETNGDIANTDRFTAGIINLSAKITF